MKEHQTLPNKQDAPLAVACSDLLGLVTELLNMLETVEESDSGKEFHPTTIQTCRCMHAAKLDKIMPEITAIVRRESLPLNGGEDYTSPNDESCGASDASASTTS
jgi:hypothetical protein